MLRQRLRVEGDAHHLAVRSPASSRAAAGRRPAARPRPRRRRSPPRSRGGTLPAASRGVPSVAVVSMSQRAHPAPSLTAPARSGRRRCGRRGCAARRYASLASSRRSPSSSMRRREVVRVGRLGPQVGDHVLELALVVQVAQDHVDLADDQLEHVELGLEQVQHRRLDGAGGDQVEDVDVVGLADAAEPADALLDRIGFQGRSKLQTAWANCRLRPSLPASVESRSRAGPRNCSMAASFASRDSPPWKTATSCPASRSRCCSISCVARNCVKITILSGNSSSSCSSRSTLVLSAAGAGLVGQVGERARRSAAQARRSRPCCSSVPAAAWLELPSAICSAIRAMRDSGALAAGRAQVLAGRSRPRAS